MWQSRKIIAFFLLLLFAPTYGAAAMPLVWCVAPGHNAVERCGSSGCHNQSLGSDLTGFQHEAKAPCSRMASGQGGCTDWSLSQPTRSTIGLLPVAPPSPDGGAFSLPPKLEEQASLVPPLVPFAPLDLIANQLAQLRTVVLLI